MLILHLCVQELDVALELVTRSDWRAVIRRMLDPDPANRPTMHQIMRDLKLHGANNYLKPKSRKRAGAMPGTPRTLLNRVSLGLLSYVGYSSSPGGLEGSSVDGKMLQENRDLTSDGSRGPAAGGDKGRQGNGNGDGNGKKSGGANEGKVDVENKEGARQNNGGGKGHKGHKGKGFRRGANQNQSQKARAGQ